MKVNIIGSESMHALKDFTLLIIAILQNNAYIINSGITNEVPTESMDKLATDAVGPSYTHLI